MLCIYILLLDRKISKLILQGVPKTIFKELILSVIKYARKYYLDSQQTGAILSIFYNTHRYFTCNLWITAEEVYEIFKKYVLHHSITVSLLANLIFLNKEQLQL